MASSPAIGIGLMGLGVVGSGVAQALLQHAEPLERKVGRPLELKRVLVRELHKPRSISPSPGLLTTNAEDILADPQVQVVIELIGGESPAAEYLCQALNRGKHVVTANKEVMAKQGPELMALAASRRLSLLFEGAVGGAIPIVGPLMKDLLANDIRSVRAIINGTTNFILSGMANQGMDFDHALKLAQQLGYAEADPSNDVEGNDAAYKLAILATLAFHTRVHAHDVFREGIARLRARDFRYAQELGYAIKLLAIAKRQQDYLQVRVHPALIPQTHLLAKVDGVFNAVEVEGDLMGRVVFHGLGAGRDPTTSAVLGDLVQIGRMLAANTRPLPVPQLDGRLSLRPIADLETRYYMRMTVADRAGVFAQIAKVLGDHNISIASVIQKDADLQAETAEIVITTHPSREVAMQRSLASLEELAVVREINNLIRVEE